MIDVRLTDHGVDVDGVPWTDRQVRQALLDAKACVESRRGKPPNCDCVCCRIAQLRKGRKAR